MLLPPRLLPRLPPLTVLGLGLKPCEVAELQRAHKAVQAVQRSMQRYDGTITRLICDDKGSRFLIAFGLPGHANEDDEQRAVLSSLECVNSLSQVRRLPRVIRAPRVVTLPLAGPEQTIEGAGCHGCRRHLGCRRVIAVG